jgi:3,4-dihydroxy 2-butanone 4-phosphate synthase/GTP cyclohydrolase II
MPDMPFARIEDALAAYARGEILVVVDDEDRENEGDLIQAAEFATAESIAFFLHHTSGYLCAPITAERAVELDLPPMVVQNTESQRTAFLVTVDYRHGTSTGISAHDRCATVRALCDPSTRPGDLARPGHINPLMAREGGVLKRATPRRPSTSAGWPASTQPGCCARSSTTTSRTWPASRSSSASPRSTGS